MEFAVNPGSRSSRPRPGVDAGRPCSLGLRQSLLLVLLFVLGWTRSILAADLPFADAFAERGVLPTPSGTGSGSNLGASREPEEPRHGDRPGGRSVWISWVAPKDGLATFGTAGSGFDTLLAVYAYERELKGGPPGPPDPTRPFDGLREVAREDDDEDGNGAFGVVQFGARAGVRYEIAVDGWAGATGPIVLTWDFVDANGIVPVILASEPDRALREGDSLTLAIEIEPLEDLELRWYHNNTEIDDADEATLVIPSLTTADVGEYKLRVRLGDFRVFTRPIEIQINSEGQTTSLARDKVEHALESGLVGESDDPRLALASASSSGPGPRPAAKRSTHALALQAPPFGVTRGFNGSQIFTTVFARRDPNEPQHCGVPGGASYWFAYQPPAAGTARLDTAGSTFDTVLAVYTYDPPFTGYAGLVSVACDNDGITPAGASRLEFDADPARTYLIVVDGANGARGTVHLNYQLATNTPPPPPVPPRIVRPPSSLVVTEGQPATFSVQAEGTEPLSYQWRFLTSALTGLTNATLAIAQTQPADSGDYVVVVANSAGSVTSQVATLVVQPAVVAPALLLEPFGLDAEPGTPAGFRVSATGTEPLVYRWFRDGEPVSDSTGSDLTFAAVEPAHAGFYHVVVSNIAGRAVSGSARLRVRVTPSLRVQRDPAGSTLSFLAQPGWRYTLELADRLDAARWTPVTSWEGTGRSVTFPKPDSAAAALFLRLRME